MDKAPIRVRDFFLTYSFKAFLFLKIGFAELQDH